MSNADTGPQDDRTGGVEVSEAFDPNSVATDREAHMWRWRLHWHEKDQWFAVMSLSQFKMLLGANIYQVKRVGSSGVHNCVGTTTYAHSPTAPADAAKMETFSRGLMMLDGRGRYADFTGDFFDCGQPKDQPAWRSGALRAGALHELHERVFGPSAAPTAAHQHGRREGLLRAAEIAEVYPVEVVVFWDRPGGPPGNGRRASNATDIAAAIRAEAQAPAPTSRPQAGEDDALHECVDVLALCERVPLPDPAYEQVVRELGDRVGYGALMTTASALWARKLEAAGGPGGGQFVAGPCHGSVVRVLRLARAALARIGATRSSPDAGGDVEVGIAAAVAPRRVRHVKTGGEYTVLGEV